MNRREFLGLAAAGAAMGGCTSVSAPREAQGRILFGACVLSFLLSPVAALLEKKLRRPPAALIALVGVILLLLLVMCTLTLLLTWLGIRRFRGSIADSINNGRERQ